MQISLPQNKHTAPKFDIVHDTKDLAIMWYIRTEW